MKVNVIALYIFRQYLRIFICVLGASISDDVYRNPMTDIITAVRISNKNIKLILIPQTWNYLLSVPKEIKNIICQLFY